jgi:hypothetical protein
MGELPLGARTRHFSPGIFFMLGISGGAMAGSERPRAGANALQRAKILARDRLNKLVIKHKNLAEREAKDWAAYVNDEHDDLDVVAIVGNKARVLTCIAEQFRDAIKHATSTSDLQERIKAIVPNMGVLNRHENEGFISPTPSHPTNTATVVFDALAPYHTTRFDAHAACKNLEASGSGRHSCLRKLLETASYGLSDNELINYLNNGLKQYTHGLFRSTLTPEKIRRVLTGTFTVDSVDKALLTESKSVQTPAARVPAHPDNSVPAKPDNSVPAKPDNSVPAKPDNIEEGGMELIERKAAEANAKAEDGVNTKKGSRSQG